MRLPILLCLAMLSSPAEAQTSTVIGVGSLPCSDWTEARTAAGPKALQLRAWLFGFISGINAGLQPHGDMLAGHGSETFTEWIDRYCREQSGHSLADAANQMATHFVRQAVATGRLRP